MTLPEAVEPTSVSPEEPAGSLGHMEEPKAERKKRKPTPQDMWRLLLVIVGIIAIIQELRKPREERTWEGKVGSFVPYDFRRPTMDRVRETYWNPDGSFLSRRVWGVGWAPNFGVVTRLFGRTPRSEEGDPARWAKTR